MQVWISNPGLEFSKILKLNFWLKPNHNAQISDLSQDFDLSSFEKFSSGVYLELCGQFQEQFGWELRTVTVQQENLH